MPLRKFKPTSAGVRGLSMPTFEEITTNKPHKPLTEKLVRGSGRNKIPARRRPAIPSPVARLRNQANRRAAAESV